MFPPLHITCPNTYVVKLQWEMSRTDNDQVLEDYMEEVRRDKIMKGEISLLGVMQVTNCGLVMCLVSMPIISAASVANTLMLSPLF